MGCANGIATCNFGRMFPKALVYGINAEKYPAHLQKPAIVQVVQKDIFTLSSNKETFANGSQDFIFSRALVKYITNWPGYIKRAFQLTHNSNGHSRLPWVSSADGDKVL